MDEGKNEGQGEQAGHPKLSDNSDGKDWAAFGRTYGEQHYSPLDQINRDTVGGLGLAWYFDLGSLNSVTGPLAVDGVIYFAYAYSQVHAMDARTGELLWVFDPEAAEAAGRKLRQGWGSRGLGWWNGKIYTGTQDGRLIAIDAKTGEQVWSVMTVGKDDYRFISGPPRAFDGKVIVGHGGADSDDIRGYVTAYDAETGEQLWRFYTVPGNPADGFENEAMRMAAETWYGEWWKHGGGGTVWNAITYDEALNQIYIGTGNGAPWNRRIRSAGKGDNLFLSSIVALDADTGEYKWHYQTNPGESWDYNASMDMELADIEIEGKERQVLMTAPKNGFFYVIDRRSGKLISAEPYVRVTWAEGIDLETGRPIEVPGSRYPDGQSFEMAPSTMGAHTWLPMAYSRQSGLVYIPANDLASTFSDVGIETEGWERDPTGILDVGAIVSFPLDETGKSSLVAINPANQEQVWRVKTPGFWNGGVVATAGGLVFQGHVDGTFNAFDADTGEHVWKFDAKAPVVAPPITYEVDGRQYVTVLTGMGASGAYLGPLFEQFGIDPATQLRRVLTFSLDGEAVLPDERGQVLEIPEDPDFVSDPESEERGVMLFGQRCSVCHGFRAVSVGAAADLRKSQIVRSLDAFTAVLKEGLLEARGMPRFDELNDQQIKDIRQYIRFEANNARADSKNLSEK
jgi:quinohemoprotein ethanol dehydrogenase